MNPERSNADDINERRQVSGEVIDMNLTVADQFAQKISEPDYEKLSGETLAKKLGFLLDADRPGKRSLEAKIIRLIDGGVNNLDDDRFYREKLKNDEVVQAIIGILNDTSSRKEARIYSEERHVARQLLFMRGALPDKTKDDERWYNTLDRLFDKNET